MHTQTTPHLLHVSNFDDLINTPFKTPINTISWSRELDGNFEEIIHAIDFDGNILELDEEDLMALNLSEAGKTARNTILSDIKLLTEHGAAPVVNIIKYYEADEHSLFSTDVYSFHVDRSPIPHQNAPLHRHAYLQRHDHGHDHGHPQLRPGDSSHR